MAPVYKATYSNVPVWMCTVNNVGVMRRQADGWVNATHILKVADLDKPRRTRILERDVQSGEHEKVQGGYGKYQGTWIPVDKAIKLAEQHGILKLVNDLLTYTPGPEGVELPTAPKVTMARKTNTEIGGSGGGSGPPRAKRARKTFSAPAVGPNLGPGAPSPKTRQAPANSPVKRPRQLPQHALPAHLQQQRLQQQQIMQMQAHQAQAQVQVQQLPPQMAMGVTQMPKHKMGASMHNMSLDATIRKDDASQSSSNAESSESDFLSDDDTSMAWNSARVPPGNVSGFSAGNASGSFPPLHGPSTDAGQAYMAEFSSKLLDFFMAPNKAEIPEMLLHPRPGPHINQAIDDEGNTAFHWTCAMGQVEVMEALMGAGANIKVLNYAGHTPLVRAIMFTNNYDMRSFPKVLELLRSTMFYRDAQGSTLLHHIAAASASRSRASSTRYYMEILLAKMSETPFASGSSSDKALTHFVNQLDINGETALHIAARNYSRKLVKVLLSYNAAPDIPNKIGRTAQEFIFEYEAQRAYQTHGLAPSSSPPRSFGGTAYWQAGSTSPRRLLPHQQAQQREREREREREQAQAQAETQSQQSHPQEQEKFRLEALSGDTSKAFVSETAQQAGNDAPQVFAELLGELAATYDAALKEKDDDIEQVRQLLEQYKRNILEVQHNIPELQKLIGNEQLTTMEVQRLSKLAHQRSIELRKVFERTQARNLALCAQKQELDVQQELQEQLAQGNYDAHEQRQLAARLSQMQLQRQQLADEIVELYGNAGSREKMHEYRRLISLCCETPVDDVDSLLEGISQSLDDRGN